MQQRILGKTGLQVAPLGFGAATLGHIYGNYPYEVGERAVHAAVDHGINFFDVSPYYGLTLAEDALGRALVGRRNKVVLATKCGRYGVDDFDFSAARITRSVDESLTRLRTDVIDLFQVHDFEFGDPQQVIDETLPAMRRLQEQGKIRFAGITGYPPALLRKVAEAVPVDTILSYCHYTLLDTSLVDELAPTAGQQGIGLINASPLSMGLLTDAGPPAWHPAPDELRALAAQIGALCRERGASVSAVALGFALSCPAVATTLSGMSSEAEVLANLRTLEQGAPAELVAEIRALVQGSGVATTWPSGIVPESWQPAHTAR